MNCLECGRINCTIATFIPKPLCQVCHNYTPDKSCKSILEDFLLQDIKETGGKPGKKSEEKPEEKPGECVGKVFEYLYKRN